MIDTTTQKISLHEERTWFIADPHFGHDAIRRHCDRPFPTVEEMDAAIWANLECVGAEDTLVVLGDLTWNNAGDIDVKRLPGKHRLLVRGNHDKQVVAKSRKWARVCDYLEATVLMPGGGKRTLVMSHYPMASWAGARNSIHLHGHTHGSVPPMATEFGGRVDAGVDVWQFRPIRLREVIAHLDELRRNGFAVPGDY
ncbi:metallophosphoesterase [Limimaricola cinnabarinus]|uniref:metallophosphoesterase n=1 Tax=Limimaricola cinnabarinus TaxID=1125964 RepID=UPI00248FF88F|nr:metallophosphoesterase [Limimaricola cinnabarinus]